MGLITVREAAQRAGVRREAIYYSIRVGKLNAHKETGHTLVDDIDINAYKPRTNVARPRKRKLTGYGYLAGLPGSVDEFLARKHDDKELER